MQESRKEERDATGASCVSFASPAEQDVLMAATTTNKRQDVV